jgi:hypothetical protein
MMGSVESLEIATEPTASEILRTLAERPDRYVSVGEIVEAAGPGVHGLAILLFALPETIAPPLPGASTIMGAPLILLSAHLMAFGEQSVLPRWIQARKIPRLLLSVFARYGRPILRWLESLSRPRWTWLARAKRINGLVCLVLSVILFLPIPFLNAVPAISLSLIAFGMIQRDGVVTALGFLVAVITGAILAGMIGLVRVLLGS